jgi:hypothetical protein
MDVISLTIALGIGFGLAGLCVGGAYVGGFLASVFLFLLLMLLVDDGALGRERPVSRLR